MIRFDKEIQAQLDAVGCLVGGVDGVIGPKTDQAIIDYQRAAGLTVDGVLGPRTETSLARDAAAKKQVCDATPTSTTAAGPVVLNGCTAAGIIKAAQEGTGRDSSSTVVSYTCTQDATWAAGLFASGEKFILMGASGTWTYQPDACMDDFMPRPPMFIYDAGCA